MPIEPDGPVPGAGMGTASVANPGTIDDAGTVTGVSYELPAAAFEVPPTVVYQAPTDTGTESPRYRHAPKGSRRLTLPSTLPAWMRKGGEKHRTRLVTISTWVRNIGALLILFAAWQLWGTAIAEHQSQDALRQQFDARVHVHPVSSGFALAPASIRAPQPPDGTPVGIVQIPKIGVNQVVVSGTDESDLDLGPGHYIGTAMPGQGGNVAIAGHRTTHGAPFNRLAELAPGDPIYLTDLAGQQMTYIVAVPPYPVDPSNVSVLNYFGDNRLTLTTCNPEFSARQRLIVVAEYQPPGVARAIPAVARGNGKSYPVKISGEAGWNSSLFPLVLLEVGLLVVLGLTNHRWSRILGREGRWLVLVPIWAAMLFILFETLTNFLPAAV